MGKSVILWQIINSKQLYMATKKLIILLTILMNMLGIKALAYNIAVDGRVIGNSHKGINIIQLNNGKTTKVIVK